MIDGPGTARACTRDSIMPDYRLYFVDHGGHIGRALELWQRDRMVRHFPAEDVA